MGFLKGRFSSLRGLRIQINERAHLKFATLWITACICVHNFAIEHEAGVDVTSDEFFIEGIRIMEMERAKRMEREQEREDVSIGEERRRARAHDEGLRRGKEKREELKRQLFNYLDD